MFIRCFAGPMNIKLREIGFNELYQSVSCERIAFGLPSHLYSDRTQLLAPDQHYRRGSLISLAFMLHLSP